jgi:hypothetical protein
MDKKSFSNFFVAPTLRLFGKSNFSFDDWSVKTFRHLYKEKGYSAIIILFCSKEVELGMLWHRIRRKEQKIRVRMPPGCVFRSFF